MSRRQLEEFEKQRAKEKADAAAEKKVEDQRRLLKQAVREVLPARLLNAETPKRGKGRAPLGGVGKREVLALRSKARGFLSGPAGLAALEAEVQHTALVILLIDGVLGTEPWRGMGHGGVVAANARFRYLENAARILADIRRAAGSRDEQQQLTEGVFDAELTQEEGEDAEAAKPPEPEGA